MIVRPNKNSLEYTLFLIWKNKENYQRSKNLSTKSQNKNKGTTLLRGVSPMLFFKPLEIKDLMRK